MRVARGHQSRFIRQDLLRAIDDVVFLSPPSHLETLQESWKYATSGHIKYLSGTCRMSRRIKRAERHEVFGTIGAGYINGWSVASNACDGGMASNLLSSCELRQWWGCSRSLTWHSSELVTLFLAVRRRYRRRFTISSPRHLFRKLLSRWDFLQFRKLTNSSSWPWYRMLQFLFSPWKISNVSFFFLYSTEMTRIGANISNSWLWFINSLESQMWVFWKTNIKVLLFIIDK